MERLYDEDLVSIETFVQKADQLKAAFENPNVPIVGAMPAGWWGVFSVNAGGTGRYADVMPVPPLTGPEGVRQAAYIPVSVRHQVQVTNAAGSPELIAQWADWFYGDTDQRPDRRLLSGNFDQEGEHWRMLTEEERQQGLVSRDGSAATWIRLEPAPEHSSGAVPGSAPAGFLVYLAHGDGSAEPLLSHSPRRSYFGRLGGSSGS
jgi:putative aldouronate transport system substrate-binding protein